MKTMPKEKTEVSIEREQPPVELAADQLLRPCAAADLGFATTDDLPDLQDVIGQPRALRALELGTEVRGIGYNIFVLGVPDSGRTTLTREYLRRKAAQEPAPEDWVYVNNFENSRQPYAFAVPTGRAVGLRKDLQNLVAECKTNIPRVFTSEEYTRERDRLVNDAKQKAEQELKNLEEYISNYNFILVKTPYGLFLGPAVMGRPITPPELEKLPEEQREKLHRLQEMLSGVLEKTMSRLREFEQTAGDEIHELDLRTAQYIVQPLVHNLLERYAALPTVQTFLRQVAKDLISNASRFRAEDGGSQNPVAWREWSTRYDVNVLVENSGQTCAPVIIENQPTYHNLLGSIGYDLIMGASYTDFSHIRAGALHRANGGYLILPARDVLMSPYAWEGLKRVLRDREIRILELGSQMGISSSITLEPQAIPLNLKVILVGTPVLYYLLRAYDEDFAKLFKVRADYATEMERTPQSEKEYALFVKSVVDDNHLAPFDGSAVARIIEHGSRMVEHQGKLSTQFGIITDLVCEADYWAKKKSQAVVGLEAVQQAIDERIYRSNRIEERFQEMIAQNMLLVDVQGSSTGQVNALSVITLGDYAFGRPTRVTAAVCVGQGGVTDIERQAKLGGPIHTKGVLILNGFLGGRYGQDLPLNLTASLTFEQSYDEVEGDSASAAELLALLSALAQIPIDQGKAITGSVNQQGQIQVIGGVNQKIEGFYEVCRQKGLTGKQGVIIPAANRSSLMLKEEVITAVAQGRFHIWPVATIDEALRLMTDREAGVRQQDGTYPTGCFNGAVAARLNQFAQAIGQTDRNGHRHKSLRTQREVGQT